jgi:hypothetical protein
MIFSSRYCELLNGDEAIISLFVARSKLQAYDGFIMV